MSDMPDDIWVMTGYAYADDGKSWYVGTQINSDDVLYIRADIHEEENKKLWEAVRYLAGALKEICTSSAYDVKWQSDGKDFRAAVGALDKYLDIIKECGG